MIEIREGVCLDIWFAERFGLTLEQLHQDIAKDVLRRNGLLEVLSAEVRVRYEATLRSLIDAECEAERLASLLGEGSS